MNPGIYAANGFKCSTCSNAVCASGQYRSGSCSGTSNGYQCNTDTTTTATTIKTTTTKTTTTTATTTTTTTTVTCAPWQHRASSGGGACGDWKGTCEHGKLLEPVSKRRGLNHCGTCDKGWYETPEASRASGVHQR